MKIVFYAAVLVPNDGKYSVFFPDFPGCFPWGNTLEEALADAVEGLAAYMEMLVDEGDPIPTPSSREEAWAKFQADCIEQGEEIPEGTLLQLVPAPELSEQQTRVNVSFKRYTLDMIDSKAEAAGMTRSGFLAAAARAYDMEQVRH